MASEAELFLDHITEMFGKEDFIRKIPELKRNGVPVHVFFYHNLPENGYLTAITYGLSESNHPKWIHGKPELIITLKTEDESWGIAAGEFAAKYQGEKTFSYGDIFTTDNPISDESEMTGFLVFAPSFLSKEQAAIELKTKNIYLIGMYPIYPEEVASYGNLGLEAFWHHPNFDMYDVKRKKIRADI